MPTGAWRFLIEALLPRCEKKQELLMSVEQSTLLGQDSMQPQPNCFIYGSNSAIRALDRMIGQIAPTDIPVLLIGESGTGKEAIALEIHRRSRQCQEPFLKFNSAELAAHLFPARVPAQASASDSARTSGGTIFLDDVSKMTPGSQDQLLEAMAGWDTTPSERYQGARLISATVANLEEDVRAGRFREELYYKINGICLRIPSLRQRSEDIPALLDLFLKKHAVIFCRRAPQPGSSTIDLLLRHTWPGNVRELESVARKMVALGDEQLALSDLTADNAPTPDP